MSSTPHYVHLGADSDRASPSEAAVRIVRDGDESPDGLELSSLRTSPARPSSVSRPGRPSRSSSGGNSGSEDGNGEDTGSLSGSLINGEHPSEATKHFNDHSPTAATGSSAATSHRMSNPDDDPALIQSGGYGGLSSLSFEVLSLRLRNLMLEDASETAEEELEMMDFDNPEDHILERKLDEDGLGTTSSSSGRGRCAAIWHKITSCGGRVSSRDWRKLRLTILRMAITVIIGVCIGLTGFAVSRSVNAMIHANLHILNDLMDKDRPAAAFFSILLISCLYTGVAALFVTFGSWQTRGSGVGRLNAYLSGMSSSKFLSLKTLFVKIGGLILNVTAGIKQGMEGPFIHIGAMIGLHISRFSLWICNLLGSRWGIGKYTGIVAGVVDERMFITSGAAAGFSVAFNAPIAGVLYVQDGAFAYWQGEYTIRTFLCTMTAVMTINMCFKQGGVLQPRGLIDVGNFLSTTITLQEFSGFIVLGLLGGIMGILFTKLNVTIEKFRQKHLAKQRLPNLLDVLACTILTVLLSFILPFMLGCHTRYDEWCASNPDRCLHFQCGPQRYSDLATFFFTLPEETICILYDRTPSAEAQIPYNTLIIFCIFYFLMACVSYGMAVPGGLFIPSIIIGAAYGRIVGLAAASLLSPPDTSGGATAYLAINPGVYAVLGSASMLGGITRMTLPISVMMIEISSDSQFLIPIMLVVLIAKVVADFGTGGLYAEHLKLDGLIMVFGDRPPTALKKLIARDVMSSRSLRKLNVISSVEDAWAAIRDTKHNAFPVTDSSLATLRSIIQRRKQTSLQNGGNAGMKRRSVSRNTSGNANRKMSMDDEVKHDHGALPPLPQVSTVGTGVFLGLIQRRHLLYVLTSMPCFATPAAARDSEPMTTLPYEMALAAAAQQRARRESNSRRPGQEEGLTPSDALEVVSLGGAQSPPIPHQRQVSTALIHASAEDGSALLNAEGANASASFVEWCARQAAGVDNSMQTALSGTNATGGSTTIHLNEDPKPTTITAVRPSPPRQTSPSLATVSSILPSSSPRLESSPGSGNGHQHMALGQDLQIQPAFLNHYINLSPFIDQGAYTVSENISARRVWALFRSLGMRHIVVLNVEHQPVGVITRRDLIRYAVAQ